LFEIPGFYIPGYYRIFSQFVSQWLAIWCWWETAQEGPLKGWKLLQKMS